MGLFSKMFEQILADKHAKISGYYDSHTLNETISEPSLWDTDSIDRVSEIDTWHNSLDNSKDNQFCKESADNIVALELEYMMWN